MEYEERKHRARTFTIHWPDLSQCLPVEDDENAKRRRRELFDALDTQGNGILLQAKAVRALSRMLPPVAGFTDIPLVVHQSWAIARDLVPPISPIGIDRMDRNQFRTFCFYLWYFFKLWDLFVQVRDTGTGDRKVLQQHFEEMLPNLKEWGIQEAAAWLVNPDAAWDVIDRRKCGWIIFDDFAEFILRRAVPQLSACGEEASRQEAIRLLRRTHPHLLQRAFPKKERFWNNIAAPPLPPPGQCLPPVPIEALEGAPSPSHRYRTQYMCDYLSPAYLPSEATTAASTPSPSRALTRSRSAAGPPSDLATGISLIRSSSMPAETMRTQGLDRQALRSRLESQLGMYSTGQMRKLLKVAGSMVLGS